MDDGVSEPGVIKWSSDTNWIIARGSLEASIAVESSDCPIAESDLVAKSTLILKPWRPDSGPCEVKIHFEQKVDISQIYVRSTARVYEIYYARSPQSSNEYLCTVRCGVAERDEKVLQTTRIEDVEGHGSCSSEEQFKESITNGESTSNGEDDWVKIKVPEVERRSLSDKINSDQPESIQDLYEATAQISDVEPCSSLTIRLVSLQDKGNLHVDEIYVFVEPAESSDSGHETPLVGSLAQNSLMAMFVPTLLQLSKSGVSQGHDKHTSDEVLKDGKTETGSKNTDHIDVGLHTNQVQVQYEESKKLEDKDTSEFTEPQQPTMANCAEPVNNHPFPSRNFENTLEELVSRVSRVEDIFLRFEEKMLRPIESIEARLQRVELLLETLAQSSHGSGLPHGTRISAPAFSCSESNSSSSYNDQSDYPTCGGPLEIEKKDLSCDSASEILETCDVFQPFLVVSAPKFIDGKDEDDDNGVTPLEDSSCIKLEPKKALSVDDALAIALNGFLATAINQPSIDIQTTPGLSSKVDEESQSELHEIKGQDSPVAESSSDRESLQYTQVLTVKAPDFSADETGNDDDLNYVQSDLNTISVLDSDIKGHDDDMGAPSDFHKNESAHDFDSQNGETSGSSIEVIRTYFSNRSLNESSEENTMDISFDGNHSCTPAVTSNTSKSDLAKDSVKTNRPQIDNETNPVSLHDAESASEVPERDVTTGEECLKDAAPHSSDPSSSLLDFDFPILDVKFTSDFSSNPECLLEALLFGSAGSSTEVPSVHDGDGGAGAAHVMDKIDETIDFLPVSQPLLVDVGAAGADVGSNLQGGLPDVCMPNGPALDASLI